MEERRNYIPSFLRERYQLLGTVTFAALFAVIFLLVTIPFSNSAWFRLGNSVFFTFTMMFAVGSLLVIIFSRIIMYKTRSRPLRWWQYILWCSLEVVVICVLYTVFTVTIAQPEDRGAAGVFLGSLSYGFIALGVPYIIAGMFFTIINQDRTIRLMNMQDVVTDEAAPKAGEEQKITLFDNAGVLKLSVGSANLYYIESDDNYIKVWYTDSKGDLKTYMLRCRLKTVEESFQGSDLVRCHRKFIVNMAKVTALRKERDGYVLDIDNDRIDAIPVTKTYSANVLSRFGGSSEDQ